MKKRINWMLAQQKAMLRPVRRMETPKTQQLSQKQSLASLSAATMNLIRCCLAAITRSEMRKPTMKVMADSNVSGEYLSIQDFCIYASKKGRPLPKQRQRKPLPRTSISSRHRGMQTQAATQGTMQVVTTIRIHNAVANAKPIRMSGITCQVDRQGISCPLTVSSLLISSL